MIEVFSVLQKDLLCQMKQAVRRITGCHLKTKVLLLPASLQYFCLGLKISRADLDNGEPFRTPFFLKGTDGAALCWK